MRPESELSFAPHRRRPGTGRELLDEMAAFSFTAELKTQGRAPQNICLRQVQKEFSKGERKIIRKQKKQNM